MKNNSYASLAAIVRGEVARLDLKPFQETAGMERGAFRPAVGEGITSVAASASEWTRSIHSLALAATKVVSLGSVRIVALLVVGRVISLAEKAEKRSCRHRDPRSPS
jgi:hypothetical protein